MSEATMSISSSMRKSKRIRGLRSSLETASEKIAIAFSEIDDEVEVESDHSPDITKETSVVSNDDSNDELSGEDSSDDEPEEISHTESKSKAVETEQQQKESISHAEQNRKRKLKEREDRNKIHKEEKRQRMLTKLPDDLLNQINDEDLKKQQTNINVIIPSSTEQGETPESDSFSMESGFASTESIPVNAPRIRPVSLKKYVQQKPVADTARQFLQRHLYGKRVQRSSDLMVNGGKGKLRYITNKFDC